VLLGCSCEPLVGGVIDPPLFGNFCSRGPLLRAMLIPSVRDLLIMFRFLVDL